MATYIITSNLYGKAKKRTHTIAERAHRLFDLLERKINAGVEGSVKLEIKKSAKAKIEVVKSINC